MNVQIAILTLSMGVSLSVPCYAQDNQPKPETSAQKQTQQAKEFVTDPSMMPGRRRSYRVLADGTVVRRTLDGRAYIYKYGQASLAAKRALEKTQ